MPWQRTTLTELREQVTRDIDAEIPGSSGLLRFSNLKIIGDVQANLSHLHYSYLDYIAAQAVPFTASEEYLEAWAALKRVYRKPATAATGTVTFKGDPGITIPEGIKLIRTDGVEYRIKEVVTTDVHGEASVSVVAIEDSDGLKGAFGNCSAGAVLTMGEAIPGINSDGVSGIFSGGADIESDADFRNRMLFAFQNPPQGGSEADYKIWASEVPGVSRVWVKRNYFGVGSVVLFIMMDDARAETGGFPVGENGCASEENRWQNASGDLQRVADYLYDMQPVTALILIVAPEAQPVNFTITNIPDEMEDKVTAALKAVFFSLGEPGGRIPINRLWGAVNSTGVADFAIQQPTQDVICDAGRLPVVGQIDFI